MSTLYKNYTIVFGKGVGFSELTAFDHALINSGVGDYNLVKLSSIMPPMCEKREKIEVNKGAVLHIAYASTVKKGKGEICSSVGIAFPKKIERNGVIMEYSKQVEHEYKMLDRECSEMIRQMLEEAFAYRDLDIKNTEIVAAYDKIEDDKLYHCTFAGVALW